MVIVISTCLIWNALQTNIGRRVDSAYHVHGHWRSTAPYTAQASED